MCNFLSSFTNLITLKGYQHDITIPDGRTAKVSHVGDFKIHTDLILKDVLFVPQFKFNLISVHKLCTVQHASLLFTDKSCLVQGPLMRTPLHLGKLKCGLYFLEDVCPTTTLADIIQKSSNFPIANIATYNKVMKEAKLWHIRLGHVPFSHLKAYKHDIDTSTLMNFFFVLFALRLNKLDNLLFLVVSSLYHLLNSHMGSLCYSYSQWLYSFF